MDFYDIIRKLITGREGTEAREIHEAIDKHQAEHDKAAGNPARSATATPAAPAADKKEQ